jgi:pyridoxamine 5'-phosphate oxidase
MSCSPVPELREADAAADPFVQFDRWFKDAGEAVPVPEAMALATATPDGAPSARMVLLKDAGEAGFVFFTNYDSRKGRELAANSRAALLFHWEPLGRQVRVEGPVERLDDAASDAYFATRPLGARIGAWVSAQSEVIGSRDELEAAVETLGQHLGAELERPPHWGGFRLRPDVFEFWQHRDDRLHDRLRYRREADGWVRERLAP